MFHDMVAAAKQKITEVNMEKSKQLISRFKLENVGLYQCTFHCQRL